MPDSRLSPLQRRILRVLSTSQPPWTLTGGAELVGFYLGHRTTRDLDLFWHGRARLPEIAPLLQALEDDRIDTPHEILVNTLNALLSRSELRDLADARVLLEAGGDLGRAVEGAMIKDGGFSPATPAWVLRSMPIPALGVANGWPAEAVDELAAFRDALVGRLALLARPGR